MKRDQPVEACNLVVAHGASVDVTWRLPEHSLIVSAMLLFANQLGVFFLLGLSPSLSGRATFAHFTSLRLFELFRILTIDFGNDFFDAWIWVRVDEVAEQICKA